MSALQGPSVIFNGSDQAESDQAAYDLACPDIFQSAKFVQGLHQRQRGGFDIVSSHHRRIDDSPKQPRTTQHRAPEGARSFT